MTTRLVCDQCATTIVDSSPAHRTPELSLDGMTLRFNRPRDTSGEPIDLCESCLRRLLVDGKIGYVKRGNVRGST